MKTLFHKTAVIFIMMVLGSAFANAQNLKGVVKDSAGEPIIGAAVVVEGSSTGTVTDIDGLWELANVPSTANLVISSIGYQTKTVAASESAEVVLSDDTILLDDVVVVGYGVQKKSVVSARPHRSAWTMPSRALLPASP